MAIYSMPKIIMAKIGRSGFVFGEELGSAMAAMMPRSIMTSNKRPFHPR
jgi:hypothetical protein